MPSPPDKWLSHSVHVQSPSLTFGSSDLLVCSDRQLTKPKWVFLWFSPPYLRIYHPNFPWPIILNCTFVCWWLWTRRWRVANPFNRQINFFPKTITFMWCWWSQLHFNYSVHYNFIWFSKDWYRENKLWMEFIYCNSSPFLRYFSTNASSKRTLPFTKAYKVMWCKETYPFHSK